MRGASAADPDRYTQVKGQAAMRAGGA